jgi:hypothetical protein
MVLDKTKYGREQLHQPWGVVVDLANLQTVVPTNFANLGKVGQVPKRVNVVCRH